MNFGELDLPSMSLPEALEIPVPVLKLPSAEIPNYEPIVVPPSDLRAPPGVKGGVNEKPKPKTKPPEIRQVTLPGTDIDVPLPTNEILVAAGTTAVVSVAATLTATAVFLITLLSRQMLNRHIFRPTLVAQRHGLLSPKRRGSG